MPCDPFGISSTSRGDLSGRVPAAGRCAEVAVSEAVLPRGRLAPSPSGQLHLGHARTFVLAWLHVRSRGGELRLRLEDLDASRCRPEFAEGALRDLGGP